MADIARPFIPWIGSEFGKCFDYFISQAYVCSGDSNLDGRLQSCANYFSEVPFKDVARRFIVTENFENITYRTNGGANYSGSCFRPC